VRPSDQPFPNKKAPVSPGASFAITLDDYS